MGVGSGVGKGGEEDGGSVGAQGVRAQDGGEEERRERDEEYCELFGVERRRVGGPVLRGRDFGGCYGFWAGVMVIYTLETRLKCHWDLSSDDML